MAEMPAEEEVLVFSSNPPQYGGGLVIVQYARLCDGEDHCYRCRCWKFDWFSIAYISTIVNVD